MREDGRSLRRERTRVALLRAARDLIERRGAVDVSIEDVAAAVRVSRRTVYDHFGSRAGLFLALARQADRDIDIEQRLAPVFAAPTGLQAMRRLVELAAWASPQIVELATAFELARAGDPAASAAWDDRMASRMEACLGVATRLREDGDLRPGVTAQEGADLIYAAISWQSWRLLVVERKWTPEQWTRHTQALLELMLTGRGTEDAAPRQQSPRP